MEASQAFSWRIVSALVTLILLGCGAIFVQPASAATSISDAYVYGYNSSHSYTGSPIAPTITVQLRTGWWLTSGDYTVTYANNTELGTATITITGQGDYTGSITRTFTIAPASLWYSDSVTGVESHYTYTGSPITPAPVIVVYGRTLTASDYDLTYANNTEVGFAQVTMAGKGNYEDSISKTFIIDPAPLSAAVVTGIQSSYTYAGSPIKPIPTLVVSGRTLTAGDYTVSYANNTGVGTATVTFTGKGNYTGVISRTFTIAPASLSAAVVTGIQPSYTYTGSPITPSPTLAVSGRTLTAGDYTVSYANNSEVGTGTVTMTGQGNYTGAITRTFAITRASASTELAIATSASSPAYGRPVTLTVTLRQQSNGSPLQSRTVLFERWTGSAWVWAGTGTTGADGAAKKAIVPNGYATTYYRARFAGDSAYVGAISSAVKVMPRPSVGTPRAPKTMRSTRSYTIYGYLKPGHVAGTYPVRIYRWKRTSTGRWKSYGYVTAKASNHYGYTKYARKVRLKSKGKWRLRAYAPADSGHAAAWSSGYDYVTVK